MNTMRKLLVDIAMRFRGPWRIPRAPLPKPRYQVLVDDNFHYMDVEKRWDKGTYATLEEALRVCRAMVQRSVEEQFEQAPGATAEKLFNRYRASGMIPSSECSTGATTEPGSRRGPMRRNIAARSTTRGDSGSRQLA
jgi:hypothetical protein